MSIHLGLHWTMIMGIVSKGRKKSGGRTILLRVIATVIAAYGVYAFFARQVGIYMLLRSHFVFFNYEEPLILFLIDYVAIMGGFVFIGHYLSKILKWMGRKKKKA